MADAKQLREELELTRNLASEVANLLKVTKEEADERLILLNIEKKSLKTLQDKNLLSKEEFDARHKVFDLEERAMKSKIKGESISSDRIKRLYDAKKIEAELLKLKQESLNIEEKSKNALMSLAGKAGLGGVTSASEKLFELWKLHPILVVGSVLLDVFGKIFGTFKNLDSAAADFRKSMGITREFSSETESSARAIAIQFMGVGVTIKDVYDSLRSVADTIGSSNIATKGMVTNMALMTAQFGISAKLSAQFLKTMGMVGKATMDSQKDMLLFTQRMSEAVGVPLDTVMEDVAAATQTSYQFLSRSPVELVKAAVQAKLMGTSLQSAVKTSASLLNFTESVRSEMEASVLLGKSINLQKARELAYHRDIKGLNNEILKIATQTNFENLDPFQQDAIARALGKSAEEIGSMVQAQREQDNIVGHMTKEQKTQYDNYKKMQEASANQVKDYAELARKQIQSMSNQSALVSITQAWNSIFAKLGENILPYIADVLLGISKLLNSMSNTTVKIVGGFVALSTVIALVVSRKRLGMLFDWFGKKTGGIGEGVKNTFKGISDGLITFSKISWNTIAKGAVVLAVMGGSLFIFGKALQTFKGVNFASFAMGLTTLVVAVALLGTVATASSPEIVIGSIALGLMGLSLMAFAKAAKIGSEALKNLGDVPLLKIAGGLSVLGLSAPLIMSAGLAFASAGPGFMLFGLALRLVAGPMERVGQSMVNLGSGLKMTVEGLSELKDLSFLGTIQELRDLSSVIKELSKSIGDIPDIKIEKLQSLMIPDNVTTSVASSGVSSEKDASNNEIVDAINALRDDMKNGSLTANVYLDSQKLDSLMGRRLAYTGNLV